MKRFTMVAVLLVILAWTSVASAATINVSVTTDKAVYLPGETVNWTTYAWASAGDNSGVALLKVDLADSATHLVLGVPQGEIFSKALISGGGPTLQLLDTEYGVNQWFSLESNGDASSSGQLVDIVVKQNPSFPLYNVGNDGNPHLYAKGSYTATIGGLHTLSATVETSGANYWPDQSGSLPVAFGSAISGQTQFTVTPEPATMVLLGLGGIALLRRRK